MIRIIRFLFKKLRGRRRLFAKYCKHSVIASSVKTSSPSNIYIGNRVSIGMRTWIDAKPHTGIKDCCLVFKDGVTIGEYNHIYATNSIVFLEDVLTANYVYVSDNLHSYQDVDTPIQKQPIKQLKPVVIGKGSWLGEHVSIIGACVGSHSVIGANSVVTKDIPDFCIAVGVPAKIIKRYDFENSCWRKTNDSGEFIEDMI